MTQIEELNETLTRARSAYYAGSPIMSDAKYVRLEQSLANLVKQYPEEAEKATVLTTVGSDLATPVIPELDWKPEVGGQAESRLTKSVSPVSLRIPHLHPMRSIRNIYSLEDLVTWAADMNWPLMTLSGKYDGISCSLTYERGSLVKAVTLGDGEEGESILDQVQASPYIRASIPLPLNLEVRGELIIKRSRMLELNKESVAAGGKPYVSTRNLVAGTMKLKDLEEVRKRQVHFMPWEVLADYLDFAEAGGDSAGTRIQDLAEFGFEVPEIDFVRKPQDLPTILAKWQERLKESDPEIGMDGVVLKIDSCAQRRDLGVGTKFTNFQVAFKAQNARTESVLRSVDWQVGRHGKLTPVANIDPVVLAGAEVRRATLNHLNWIQDMGLKIGSRVMVVRSGDVIPQIVEVLDEV